MTSLKSLLGSKSDNLNGCPVCKFSRDAEIFLTRVLLIGLVFGSLRFAILLYFFILSGDILHYNLIEDCS